MPNFTADWIVEGSFPDTLRNLINRADPGALAGRSPEQITEALLDELSFISVYNEQEKQELKEYLQQREQYGREVIARIGSELQQLGPEGLRHVAEKIAQLAKEDAVASTLAGRPDLLAMSMVSHPDVTEVVGCLVGLLGKSDAEQKKRMRSIIECLVPFNYAPEVIRDLAKQVTQTRFGLVTDAVSTRTLAEVIMAGYDGKPVEYASAADSNELRGKTALDYQEEPEEGPGDPHAPQIAALRSVRSLLLDFLALKGSISSRSDQTRRDGTNGNDEADLEREIGEYATKLRGALRGISRINEGRTVYCVLRLPEKEHQRAFRIEVLKKVAHYVPELLFVELVPARPGREFELQEYLAHVIPL